MTIQNARASHGVATGPDQSNIAVSNREQNSTGANANKRRPFTMIPHDVARNKTWSMELRCLYLIVATFPQDGSWIWHKNHLQGLCNIGDRKYRRVIAEAKRFGFLQTINQKYVWNLKVKLSAGTSLSRGELGGETSPELGAKTSPLSKNDSSNNERSKAVVSIKEDNQKQKQDEERRISIPIADKKKENCEKERKAARLKLATAELEVLYEEFCEKVELPAAAFPINPAERRLGRERLVECANFLKDDRSAKAWTDEHWVDAAADVFWSVMNDYLKLDWVKNPSWLHLCSVKMFRSLMATKPKKQWRL